MSNVKAFPLNDQATPEQVLRRVLDRHQAQAFKRVMVIWSDDDGTLSYSCSRMTGKDLLWDLEATKLTIMGVARDDT